MSKLKTICWLLLWLAFFAVGCQTNPRPAVTSTLTATPSLPPPSVRTTKMPTAKAAAQAFLEAWKSEDFQSMYGLLAKDSQAAISQEDFVKHFQDIAVETALQGIDYSLLSAPTNPGETQVEYQVTLHSNLVGDVTSQTQMGLILEGGQWRVRWDDTLVNPDLQGGNYLKMQRDGYTPQRALLYDRNGNALVEENVDAMSVAMGPDEIDPDRTEDLYNALARVSGIPVDNIQRMADSALPGAYFPLAEVPLDFLNRRGSALYNLPGAILREYTSPRFYPDGGIAPHVIGYVGQVQAAEVEAYRRKGYLPDELVGQAGLEKWGEQYLDGVRGGELMVMNSQGQAVKKLAEAPAQPSQDIYTTLDKDFQEGVQQAVSGFNFRGAVVVLERDTGRVLAMVSFPGFDPNAFTPGNLNGYTQLQELSSPAQPMFNRATMGQYPLGSVFKIITTAAALQSGRYTPETTYQCGYDFTELAGLTLHDWTWDHFQEDGTTQPSGLLTLPQGLIRSCNPFFWHIGLDLYRQGLTTAISDMARGFGLGSLTGIQGVQELPGNVPDPQSEVDATNLAIGQGDFQVTPLQVADFAAAVGNGGTLYQPQVIEKIAPPNGEPTFVFTPTVRGKLPVSPENLQMIQEAMTGVIRSTRPRGTAEHVFRGLNINIAGKTGTATTSSTTSHAWFTGYTFQGREDKPDIAIAVVVENIGEGSDYAAPIFRRVVELYFQGRPGRLYRWEEKYNVERTPTPEETETPTPEGETSPLP